MTSHASGRQVVVSGAGACTPLGLDLETTWHAVLNGECAAADHSDLEDADMPSRRACRITEGLSYQGRSRGQALALVAAREALADAKAEDLVQEMGVFVGTTMGESEAFETPQVTASGSANADVFANACATELRLGGPRRTYGAACAAGNYAIGAAVQLVRSGRATRILCGGVEPFSRIALIGFARMRAMTPDWCRPFDAERRGMQLSEGAGFFVVEDATAARERGVWPRAMLGGLGLSCDAHHPTSPRADGSGMADAINRALNSSDLGPESVDWVNAHGTGTPKSDAAEAKALHSVFGGVPPPVTSLKGALGHSLGAASAIEAALSVRSLEAGVVPPTANFEKPDKSLDLDVVAAPRRLDSQWVINCGYAFGGLNSALCIGVLS